MTGSWGKTKFGFMLSKKIYRHYAFFVAFLKGCHTAKTIGN